MDYKYIEQLLAAYWECATTVEEERILRLFFSKTDVPAHIAHYKPLFEEISAEAAPSLGADFDERVMQSIAATAQSDTVVVKAKRVSLFSRLRPLYKAAAVVAIILTLGNAAQHSFTSNGEADQAATEFAEYKDTYTDPKTAFEHASKAIQMLSQGAREKVEKDSLMRERSMPKGDNVE